MDPGFWKGLGECLLPWQNDLTALIKTVRFPGPTTNAPFLQSGPKSLIWPVRCTVKIFHLQARARPLYLEEIEKPPLRYFPKVRFIWAQTLAQQKSCIASDKLEFLSKRSNAAETYPNLLIDLFSGP